MSALAIHGLAPTLPPRHSLRSPHAPGSQHSQRTGQRPAHAGAVRVQSRPRGRAGLRLTRAGRLLVTSVALIAVVSVGFIGLAGGAAGTGAPRTVTVEAGQTLSDLAAAHLSDVSISTGVSMIQEANDLDTSQIQAGQTLVIPSD